jgi:hypothetical protein
LDFSDLVAEEPPADPEAGCPAGAVGRVSVSDREVALLALLARREREVADVDIESDFVSSDDAPADSVAGTLDEVFAALGGGL